MEEYDYIIIGGGSAGCVLARRLVEAGHHVCLLEAGKKDKSPLIHIPLGVAAILPTKHVNWTKLFSIEMENFPIAFEEVSCQIRSG